MTVTDIRSETPFWLMKNGYLNSYTQLSEDLATDFVIIGGGISGALLARNLARRGVSVVVLEAQHIAMGSTAASTALLQYDIDLSLHEMIDLLGEKRAVRAYQLSLKALQDLESLVKDIQIDCGFTKRSSVRLAKFKKDIPFIESEFAARKANGFEVEFWDADEVREKMQTSAPAALYSKPSATADPYLLTQGLIQDSIKFGARIFDKTLVKKIDRNRSGVVIHTAIGHKVKAKKVVIACGYEAVNFIPIKVASLSSTFAFITEPLPTSKIWYENCTFWNTSDPYCYGRTTDDDRVIFGGGDEPFYDPEKRDELIAAKSKYLKKEFSKIFPEIQITVDYKWAGTFIETDDGLPYIGKIKQLEHTYFALGYGGNGITFSQMAADILSDILLGRNNDDAKLFSFDRRTD